MAKSWGRCVLPICCLLLLASVGCYTVIKHPRLAAEGQAASEDYTTSVTFGDDCRSCHAAGRSGYHAIAVPPPRLEPSWRWTYYYNTPWWQSYYAPAAAADEAEASKRPFDRRRQTTSEEQAPAGFAPAAQPLPPATAGAVARPSTRDSSTTAPAPKEDSGKRRARRGTVRPNH